MTLHLGNVDAGLTLYIPWHTFDSNGASITLTGLAVTDIEIYKNGSVTQRSSDAGYALLDTDGIDFDGITGIHGISIDLNDNTDAGFYSAGAFYWVVVSAVTVDTRTVNFVLATFRIGPAAVNVSQWLGTAAATPTVAGVPEVDVTHWLGTAAATPTVAGVPEVDVTHIGGGAQSATDLKDFVDDGYDPSTNKVEGVKLADTLTTYTGDTPQTGDSFARIGATGSGLTSLATQASVDAVDNFLDTEIGAPSDFGSGASLAKNMVDIEALVDDIGVAGAGLSAVPWNAAWDAEVQSEVDDALVARNLDKLVTVSGTADSGSTTTMVDAARTEADNDYWKGAIILFTSGNIAGQARIITDFVAATDTFTFAPPLTQAVATQTYVILPAISVWDDVLAEHLISGSTGAALNAAGSAGDPWSTALPGAYGAGTAGKIVGDNITGNAFTRLGAPAGASIAADIAAIEAQTDDIGAAGAGLTALGDARLANLDATVSSRLATAGYTAPPSAAVVADAVLDEDMTGHQTQGSLGQAIGDPVADTNTIYKAVVTDAAGATVGVDVVAVKAETASIQTDTDDIQSKIGTPAGASVSADIAAIEAQTDDIGVAGAGLTALGDARIANLDAAMTTRATPAQVNAEVLDVLTVDTFAQPGQEAPAATTTFGKMFAYLYKGWRNKKTQTATTRKLFADNETTVDQVATDSDDSTTYVKGELVSGP